ncbi:histidine kinase dimerization/phospho-acceptor domain-containing protein [Gluconobacter oxydans]|uniref:histidine kinase dimerization/phospho-acceptor domain-containing protein n=1 Tax=Gluconobacter oxydans TaxID=442 RepID=UPI0034638A18
MALHPSANRTWTGRRDRPSRQREQQDPFLTLSSRGCWMLWPIRPHPPLRVFFWLGNWIRHALMSKPTNYGGALLTSISHDLRTPLASILGATSSLESYGEELDGTARQELLQPFTTKQSGLIALSLICWT